MCFGLTLSDVRQMLGEIPHMQYARLSQAQVAAKPLPARPFLSKIDLTQRQMQWDSQPDENGMITRTTVLLNVPPASTRQEESRQLFYSDSLKRDREDPTLPPNERRYITDQRFLDPGFRMQQARRYWHKEGEPFEKGEKYWVLRFCKYEIEELIGKENQEILGKQLITTRNKVLDVVESIFDTLVEHKKTVFTICGAVVSSSLAIGCFFSAISLPIWIKIGVLVTQIALLAFLYLTCKK